MNRSQRGIAAISGDEKLLASVKRHYAGLLIIYLLIILGVVAAVGLVLFMVPAFSESGDSGLSQTVTITALLVVALAFLFLIVETQVYNQNQLIITDQNVTQISQRGLFSRKVSELSMANVEDVTADQHGILAHIFGYGELRIETAGEQNNFKFPYCPDPDYYGKMILDARQQFVSVPQQVSQQPPQQQPPAAPQPPVQQV